MLNAPTPRTRLRRLPERGRFDEATIHAILDEGFVCHLGFVEDGKPVVIPTCYGREGDAVFVHGSAASRMMRALSGGIDVCMTVTLVDGIVLARSGFHHSINYRSVVIFGSAELLQAEAEKEHALAVITNHIVPGRWEGGLRPATSQEIKGTTVLRLALDECSAKVRTGGPKDEPEDRDWPVWAGVLPLTITAGAPAADGYVPSSMQPPEYLRPWKRPSP